MWCGPSLARRPTRRQSPYWTGPADLKNRRLPSGWPRSCTGSRFWPSRFHLLRHGHLHATSGNGDPPRPVTIPNVEPRLEPATLVRPTTEPRREGRSRPSRIRAGGRRSVRQVLRRSSRWRGRPIESWWCSCHESRLATPLAASSGPTSEGVTARTHRVSHRVDQTRDETSPPNRRGLYDRASANRAVGTPNAT